MRAFICVVAIACVWFVSSAVARGQVVEDVVGPPVVVGLTEDQEGLQRMKLDEPVFVKPYIDHGAHGGKPVQSNIDFLKAAAPWFHYGLDLVELTEVPKQAVAIIDGGERDPWVLCVAGRVLSEAGGNDFRAGLAMQKASEAIEASDYPSRVKALVLLWQARVLFNRGQAFDVWSTPYDRFAEHLVEHLGGWSGDRAEAKYLLRLITMSEIGWKGVSRDAKLKLPAILEAASFKNAEAECIRLTLLSGYYVDRGWEIRGRGYAHTVPEENWEPFYAYLAEAERCGEAAFARCPDWEIAASQMGTIAVGLGDRAKESPEIWFARATAAKYDYRPAYRMYADYLHPKWSGGGPDRLIAFGRLCLKTQRFDTRVPTTMTDVPRLLSVKGDSNPFEVAFDDKDVYEDAMAAVMGTLVHEAPFQQDMSKPEPVRIIAGWRVRVNVTRALIYTSAMGEYDRGYEVIERYGPELYEPELNRYPYVTWMPLLRTLINAGPGKEFGEKANQAYKNKEFDAAVGHYEQWRKAPVPDGPHAEAIRKERESAFRMMVSAMQIAKREELEKAGGQNDRDER